MNLADEIIYGRVANVERLLEHGEDANEIDQYGYTPLIEAAIVNNEEIATLLIEHGADPKEADLIGGTALMWAVENHNLPLCKLLLDKGADPNAYTSYGQPVLFKAVLRNQQKLKELLYRYGADLHFAQDYINTKLIGHRFQLVGKVDIVDATGRFIEIEFEGFILDFTVNVIQSSLMRFKNNFAARELRPYFEELQQVIDAFAVASEAFRYRHYLLDVDKYRDYIDDLLNRELLLIPIGYEGHAITLIKSGDLLAVCDRGEKSRKVGHSVVIYRVHNPTYFNGELIKHLMYQAQDRYFMETQMAKILDLEPIDNFPLPSQISGNCSWANVESAVPVIFYLLSHKKRQTKEAALDLFEKWCDWDKDRALHECIESFYYASPARKASKAAVLAAVVFQSCGFGDEKDLDRAEKILPILNMPAYRYVLKSYLKIYTKQTQSKEGKNLLKILDYLEDQLPGF